MTILHDCIIGRDVIIHAGCVVGSDGFGFEYDGTEMIKIPQLGIVQIDDKVELGANNTIDRATNGKTWIKSGVKTDNLVQIAHNVEVGENTRIVSQSGISGSTRIGREVIIGGQTGIGDHLEISDGTMIGSKSGVYQSIPTQGIVSGIPSMPHKLWLKTRSIITRLPKIYNTLQSLEKRVKNIEQRLK